MIELTIPRATPSLNPMLGQFWAKRIQSRREWQWLVRAARLDAKVHLAAPIPKARVTITRYGRRMLDKDNLYGGTKMLTDSLVKDGLIKDDSPEHIELTVNQHVTKSPRTVVHIEAL